MAIPARVAFGREFTEHRCRERSKTSAAQVRIDCPILHGICPVPPHSVKFPATQSAGDVSDGSRDRKRSGFEATPILVDGTLYFTTPFNRVIALDPETGKQRWAYDPKIDLLNDELAAAVALIDALLGQGKSVEAAKEKQVNQALAARSTNQLNRLQFDLASVRVEMAIGHPTASRAQLERTLEDARAHHFLGVELETQLALAQLKKKQDRESRHKLISSHWRNVRATRDSA
ncbi:MAG: hypothetical protein WBV46_13710 [Terriglobales bacterium]